MKIKTINILIILLLTSCNYVKDEKVTKNFSDKLGIELLNLGDTINVSSCLNIELLSDTVRYYDLYQEGIEACLSKKYDKAINIFDSVIKLDSNFYEVYNFRALANEGNGNIQAAHSDFDMAINLNRYNRKAYYAKGALYYKLDNYLKSIEYLKENLILIYKAKDFLQKKYIHRKRDLHNFKDILMLDQEIIDEYCKWMLSKLTLMDKELINTFFGLGKSRYYINDFEGAIEEFDNVISVYNSMNDFYNIDFYDNIDIIEELKKIVSSAYYQRGLIYVHRSNIEMSISDFAKATELNPDLDSALVYSYRLKYKIGDTRGALIDFMKRRGSKK